MYVTRPLSLYKRNPSALSLPPPEGPNSGILIIQDEEAEPTCCFGLFKSDQVEDLPFPQNKNLKVRYTTSGGAAGSTHTVTYTNRVIFVPVLNQPLSSNQYHVIERRGRYKGEAHTNATEEDVAACCFGCCIPDMEPEPFDPKDARQQFEIRKRGWGGYVAKSVAPDGFPPGFLRRKGWRVVTSTASDFELNEARGLDRNLRDRLPDFHFPLSQRSSASVVVGKWYCPCMFIKEGKLKDQFVASRYYEMTLEQRWEQIFARENSLSEGNSVIVDAVVQREVIAVAGREVAPDERNVVDGIMWFRSSSNVGGEASVGLSLEIVERMKWEQERAGCPGGNESYVTVKRVEEFGGIGGWKKLGCYVLVERFVLRRMDGSLVLTYDFKHTHQIRSKWE
ncbi:PREDICTED: uncharacterized protein LOC105122984 [Populus euphratica]|uniref:Uncharacterized protein LOC105122984 n=1 Tax=Populus euphratica TaxID=75702 RepID=A0AAJ6XIY9_POPEU|nr:PREDICTED: uncharacterized protein LOC105122984 [Populus euphratica]